MIKGRNVLIVLLLVCANIHAATLFSEDFATGLTKRWEPVKFEGLTQYSVVKDDGNPVLQACAVRSASGLATKIDVPLKPNTQFSWRWKIDKTPSGGTEDAKKSFDHTVRIFVAFKSGIGPPRTINYVWANKTAVEKTFYHPSSNRARFIVLESGDAKAGQWVKESRDIHADWKMLFGKDEPPNVASIGLMTDSDGTESTVTGWYDDFVVATP